MASPVSRLSLAAQYDDLCRYTKVLTEGCEKEFSTFVVEQHKMMKKCKEYEAEIQTLKNINQALKKQIATHEAEKSRFECQMKLMKNVIDEEIRFRKRLEAEKSSMVRQITLIKEVLLMDGTAIDNHTRDKLLRLSINSCRQTGDVPTKLTTIEESYGSSLISAYEFDDTDDDVDTEPSHHRKRRSGRQSSGDPNRKHKRKSDIELQSQFKHEFTVASDATPEKNEGNFRSSSEPSLTVPDFLLSKVLHKSDSAQIKACSYDQRIHKVATISVNTPVGRYSTGGKLSRTHALVSKTVLRTEKCYPCGKVIKFCKQALKCSDCRIICHRECREQCPLPCIPVTLTPTKSIKGTIADYTSSISPMIPSIIVHCVNEIESRGMKEMGLYRRSGSERDIKDLKDKLLKGNVTSLNRVDIHAVCGTIKEFLRSLKDSLVTRAAWHVFVDSAEHKDETIRLNLVYEAVCELPQPNKETLAFLILHLQRVADAVDCKMPLDNLAKIFGPTIVGYSTAVLTDSSMLTETRKQYLVMQCLLMIPSDVWQNILNLELPEVFYNPQVIETPEPLPAPTASRLGPIYPSSDQKKNIRVGRTSLTPRNIRTIIKNENLFGSPNMK